jgi:hypothetical protein
MIRHSLSGARRARYRYARFALAQRERRSTAAIPAKSPKQDATGSAHVVPRFAKSRHVPRRDETHARDEFRPRRLAIGSRSLPPGVAKAEGVQEVRRATTTRDPAAIARGLSVARAAVRLRHRSRGSPCPRPAGRRRPRLEGSDQPRQRRRPAQRRIIRRCDPILFAPVTTADRRTAQPASSTRRRMRRSGAERSLRCTT